MDKSILFSLGFLSQNSLWKLSLNHGYKGIYRVRRTVTSQFFPNKVFWQLDLAIGLTREFKLQANGLACLGFLFCSVTTSATLQLLACLTRVHHSGGLQP